MFLDPLNCSSLIMIDYVLMLMTTTTETSFTCLIAKTLLCLLGVMLVFCVSSSRRHGLAVVISDLTH